MKGSVAPVQLIRPVLADIPFIMATERIAGYEQWLGRSDEAWHRAALADTRFAYFLGRLDGEPIGFAILQGWAAAEQVTHIKRFAVVRPGQGLGKAFLGALAEAVFAETKAWRLSLGLFSENLRARRAYEGVGFQAEGISRGSALFHGVNRDELVMALLRPEWTQAKGGAGALNPVRSDI
jgi:RimJ/RimL family protein N-acetyltransferase